MKNLHPYARIAIALGVAVLIWKLAFYAGSFLFGGASSDYQLDRHIVHAVSVFILAVPAILLLWKYSDRKPFAKLGFGAPKQAWKHFLIGAGIWLAPASVGFALCLAFGWVSIETLRPAGEILAFVPLLILLVFVYEAFPEELIFRGYIFANLTQKLKGYSVVTVQAALFTLFGIAIGAAVSWDRIAIFFFAAWVLGSLRMTSGNIWAPIGFHVAFQTVAQLFLHESRGFFLIENAGTLQLIAIGIVPFACAELLARRVYKAKK